MTDDAVHALRQAFVALEHDASTARSGLDQARAHLESVTQRLSAFRERVEQFCVATGVDEGEIMRTNETDDGRTTRHAPLRPRAVVAIPAREGSQRWFAGQALHMLQTEAPVDEIAAKMVEMGYEHARTPANDRQLQQSLHALPSQVSWIVQGSRRGTLRLDLGRGSG